MVASTLRHPVRPRIVHAFVVCLTPYLLSVTAASAESLDVTPPEATPSPFHLVAKTAGGIELQLESSWNTLLDPNGKAAVDSFPLSRDVKVDLSLERFRVTTRETRFVLGSPRGDDTLLDFDPESVLLLRGRVAGELDSRVFLALSPHGGFGAVRHRGQHYRITARDPERLQVRAVGPAGGSPLDVPLCGVDDPVIEVVPWKSVQRARLGGAAPIKGLRQIELAVETDYEFFSLFGNLNAASAYVVSLYAAVSEIYIRDVAARVDLSFVRLWDDPEDLFNEPNPFGPFQDYWEANMGGVHRDVAQFFSGRRDLPWGGVANLGGFCDSSSYSVAGYAMGFFADTESPSVFNRDITVTAHEIGHNANSSHTHSQGIDTCNDENSTPQRGTIMSYCGQTFTGGASNTDLRFHTGPQAIMRDFILSSSCLVADCNQNGVDDSLDIGGVSLDQNMNGVPDECEDCNGNSVLDDADIAAGTSNDLDGDGVPDECQPDCNGNQVPDGLDIASATSVDLYGNGIPDECEADCNDNDTPDYDEIQSDMSLDLNRNARLDACEDCDDDGTPDLVALDHAHNLWLASLDHSRIREYLATVGPLARVSDDAGIQEGQDLLITNDRRVLVSSRLDHRVVEFTIDGALVGDLVASGAGGLSEPAGLALAPGGRLLVASRGSDAVLAYDLASGAPRGDFIAAGAGGLSAPFGLAWGAVGHLLVTSADNRVLEYDAAGAFVGELVSVAGNGGLSDPHGLLVLPSGHLLVASYGSDQVLEYDPSGAFVRQFNQGGTDDRLTLDQPWSLRLGPDGDVYVSRAHDHGKSAGPAPLHLTNARVYHFEAQSGFLVRAYVLGVNSGVEHPTGFDFVPGDAIDCNLNLIPDACDVASGTSQDLNGDGVPDSCVGVLFADGFESGTTSAW
ncbi:MAG: M12 family metallo-peptidase [Acidobacteriota bacterium]